MSNKIKIAKGNKDQRKETSKGNSNLLRVHFFGEGSNGLFPRTLSPAFDSWKERRMARGRGEGENKVRREESKFISFSVISFYRITDISLI